MDSSTLRTMLVCIVTLGLQAALAAPIAYEATFSIDSSSACSVKRGCSSPNLGRTFVVPFSLDSDDLLVDGLHSLDPTPLVQSGLFAKHRYMMPGPFNAVVVGGRVIDVTYSDRWFDYVAKLSLSFEAKAMDGSWQTAFGWRVDTIDGDWGTTDYAGKYSVSRVTPEPSTFGLAALGAVGILARLRRRS